MTFKPLKNHLILILAFTVNFIQAQPITDYWEDGTIKTKGQLLDGERHGFWQKWHSNGSIEYEGSYKQGKSVGIWKYYCKHGFTEKITKWKEGKCYEIVDYFLSGTPNVYLHFEKGLSVQEYIEYHRIEEWCKGNQYRITNMRID